MVEVWLGLKTIFLPASSKLLATLFSSSTTSRNIGCCTCPPSTSHKVWIESQSSDEDILCGFMIARLSITNHVSDSMSTTNHDSDFTCSDWPPVYHCVDIKPVVVYILLHTWFYRCKKCPSVSANLFFLEDLPSIWREFSCHHLVHKTNPCKGVQRFGKWIIISGFLKYF